MNIENLNKMADFIETISTGNFDMSNYRVWHTSRKTPECKSIGCVIGHCTILDESPLPCGWNGDIKFDDWSEDFTGIDVKSNEWDWCFSCQWADSDNTPTGAAKRIRYLINNGLPSNWRAQMEGEAELSYE